MLETYHKLHESGRRNHSSLSESRQLGNGLRHDQGVASKQQSTSASPKPQRRRQIDPTTCERDYSSDEIEFMHAVDDYKRRSGRMFPTCSELLEVVRSLGYVKLNESGIPVPFEVSNTIAADEDGEDDLSTD